MSLSAVHIHSCLAYCRSVELGRSSTELRYILHSEEATGLGCSSATGIPFEVSAHVRVLLLGGSDILVKVSEDGPASIQVHFGNLEEA